MRWRITSSPWLWANGKVEPRFPKAANVMNSSSRQNVKRVLILGHSGFIGSHLVCRLPDQLPFVEIVGEELPTIDLTRDEDTEKLAPLFDAGTTVIMCAAMKRQMGDNLDTFSRNVAMAVN